MVHRNVCVFLCNYLIIFFLNKIALENIQQIGNKCCEFEFICDFNSTLFIQSNLIHLNCMTNFTNCHGKKFGKMHADANIVRIHLHLGDSHDAIFQAKTNICTSAPNPLIPNHDCISISFSSQFLMLWWFCICTCMQRTLAFFRLFFQPEN